MEGVRSSQSDQGRDRGSEILKSPPCAIEVVIEDAIEELVRHDRGRDGGRDLGRHRDHICPWFSLWVHRTPVTFLSPFNWFSLCFDRTPLTLLSPFNWFLNDLDKIKTKTSTSKPLEL